MVEEQKYDTDVLVFEDLNLCNERLIEELEKYPYDIVVFGLDCEWVSQGRQVDCPICPVALLQLAFPNGRCFLVRLCQMDGRLPDKLREILQDRNVLKAGVGIGEDAKKLNSCYGLVVQGCVDLRHVASRCQGYVKYCIGEEGARSSMSLSALSQQILGVTLDKDWRIRCSDWEAQRLSERQIQYAANDAIVAAKIFFVLAFSKLKEKEERCDARNNKVLDHNCESIRGNAIFFQPTPNPVACEDENMSVSCTEGNHAEQMEKQAPESSSELILDESEQERTNNYESGIFSGLFSKLTEFSLGSMFGAPKGVKVDSDQKSKVYPQYPSFKSIEVTEGLLGSHELWSCVPPLCQGVVDVPFKTKLKEKNNKCQSKEKSKSGSSSQTRNKQSGLQPRRAPLYQNCVIEAPDGEMLSTCDKRKAVWYLCRNLADVVKEDPYTIRLKFEPSGRPQDPEHNYYLTFKENMCVVCGRDDSYMRKNIIPHDYRKHFPACMKDHHSHDVLLLCPSCHMISTYHDDLLRKSLAEKYHAPLGNQASSQVARLVQDPVLKKVKSAAKALLLARDKIPERRRDELLSIVAEFLDVEHPTDEMLMKASELETRRENCDFVSHGREVVQKVKEQGELLDFERMWREHFLERMKPNYLPPLWTVDHEQEKVKKLLEQELSFEKVH